MFDLIDKEEYLSPEESIKKYLYFSGEDELPRESWASVQVPLESLNVQDLHRNDFQQLLRNSELTEEQRKHYHSQFIKTKRIYKREKAKLRHGLVAPTNAMFIEQKLEPVLEDRIEEHSTTGAGSETFDKDEDQKRKKRMSAQISRDRKKLYIERMEQENKALKLRNSQLEAENDSLKKEMESTKCKNKQPTKVDRSLKGFFIMSLILLTSVNKHFQKSQGQLSLNQQSLLKRAADILEQYNKQEFTVTLPQLQQFQRDIEHQATKEMMMEEADSLLAKTEFSHKPTIFLQTFAGKECAMEGDRKVRKSRKRQGAIEISQVAN